MDNKKIFGFMLILAVAILTSAAIIFPSALGILGNKAYRQESQIKDQMPSNPEAVVEEFYAGYLEAFGDPAIGTFRSPLADKDYQESAYLTPSFIEHVDEILAGFEGQGGYDPFLCAQDVPQEIQADGVFYHGTQASMVVMRTSFPNHFFSVDLYQSGETWQIGNITCGFSPEGTAKAFYTWYLAYIGDRASDHMRNPLVDGAYRESGFLSEDFIQELDEILLEGIAADPILMAQDIPHDFSVDPGMETGSAIVHLQFGTETVQHLKVMMIEEMGGWKITEIALAE
jgi:hypothetical protein